MKIKIRHLLNPLILNQGQNVGFFGDSEYVAENGVVIMGYWLYKETNRPKKENVLKLDDTIDDSLLFTTDGFFEIENDNGIVCLVQFRYYK